MMKAKAVCVMRTDLRNSDGHKVPKGKLIAQGGHAFVGLLTNLFKTWEKYPGSQEQEVRYTLYTDQGSALDKWLGESFTKIVLAVDSEEELMELAAKAMYAGINYIVIEDNGLTEFHKPTITCLGLGPDWEDKIDKITGHLKGFQ